MLQRDRRTRAARTGRTRRSVRLVILGAVAIVALAIPASAFASWLIFYSGDIGPAENRQTTAHQQRYGKLMSWVNSNDCAKMWYRNNGSIVDYYAVQECDGVIDDARNSTASAWVYCRNPSPFTINADCYSCINGEC